MDRNYTISTLKSILYNEQTFVKFIGEQGEFFNIDSAQYVKDLNNYVSIILLFDTSSIGKNIFDRINSINMKYNFDYFYSYSSHITNQKNTLTATFIEQILNDENLLAMFLDFENHPFIFQNLSLDICISQITLCLKKAAEKGLPITKKTYQNFQKIIKRYPSHFKKKDKLDGELPKGTVNKELEDYILKKIDFSKSELAIALQIYIELCKVFIYDATFLAFNQDIKIPIAKAIYDKKIDDVTLNQNILICCQFSDIYAHLLIRCGFEARVKGDFHKSVVFKCNGNIVEADSSKQLMGSDGFYFCDLTRAKLNLPVGGFSYVNDKEKMNDDLNLAYMELGINNPFFMLEIIDLLNRNLKREPLDRRMQIINQKSRTTLLQSVDYIGYLLAIVKSLFTLKELNDMNLYTIYIRYEDRYEMGILVAKDDLENNVTDYYLFHNSVEHSKKTEGHIKNLLNKEVIKINRKDDRIKKLMSTSLEQDPYRGRII